jgi:hypothetical protein
MSILHKQQRVYKTPSLFHPYCHKQQQQEFRFLCSTSTKLVVRIYMHYYRNRQELAEQGTALWEKLKNNLCELFYLLITHSLGRFIHDAR